MSVGRSAAPVDGSVRWLLGSIALWELIHLLRAVGPEVGSSWPVGLFDLLLLTVVPALTAFAFIRLFLAVVQSNYGSLNTYTLTSSPWSWMFWLGLGIALLGQGSHAAADLLQTHMPDVVANGEFGELLRFMHEDLGHWLLGAGFLMMSILIIFLGMGSSYRVFGGERMFLGLGSVITYGVVVLFLGVEGGQLVPAIIGSGLLAGVAFWVLPARDLFHDPVGLLVVPGTALGGLALLIWGLLVGGQPTPPW